MRSIAATTTLLVAAWSAAPAAAGEADTWAGYLDYAYVFSSAEPDALQKRLEQYGREAGKPLRRYVAERFEAAAPIDGPVDEVEKRREAIGYLLDYLARAEPDSLERSVDAIRELDDRLERHENRYWYHYILAHQALEKGRAFDFVGHVLDLWKHVVVPLEAPYETLQILSLNDSPNSGFASALPYVYENVARIVLIRSQKMGVNDHLDPLGTLVRLLHDGRVGGHPDVIPVAASSKEYLDRIVARLDGPESDAGSLTFTLALFEATRFHEESRAKLAQNGLDEETIRSIRMASGAYQIALDRAETLQGKAAVYTRVLRQLGEVYAAKQRLQVDPEIETPFSIDEAIKTYQSLQQGREGKWKEYGYASVGREAYVEAMHRLWEEIQESTLNAADYFLDRSVKAPQLADDYSRDAVRLYSRYLTFFLKYATAERKEGVPESAYFAAHEAAKGVGDAFLLYATRPTPSELDLAIRRYRAAMTIFPFDRTLWSSLATALQRQGRESEYVGLARPAAEKATRSRALDGWIQNGEPEAERLAVLRRAFADSMVVMYLGFAEGTGIDELEQSLVDLRAKRDETKRRLEGLKRRRGGSAVPASYDEMATGSDSSGLEIQELAELNREIQAASALLEKLNEQIEARTRTLPLYKSTLATDGLAAELRARRDHPVHTLLRRMYHETSG